ncbi:hypothetical protein ZOSMA_105G00460 [Zostera marina]|uniref:Uncharacterized protein n=1 Tax=Zostera marina TaxID=29655 RepID=A0A0K9Q4L4_ZOSMR|nr:hypothetical protein ZOSMA_105G00460 [Zostera marina]
MWIRQCILLVFVVFVFFHIFAISVAAKSGRAITDLEIAEKKSSCNADIVSGLWGRRCKSSMIEKENCALRCLSSQCYDYIYGGDPLEEGERNHIRWQEFKYCMHRSSLGESLDGVKGAFNDY